MEKNEFIKDFNENVLFLLQKTCTLLDLKCNITYLNEDFTTIINVVLFYTGYGKTNNNDLLAETYCFQMDIANAKLKDFYRSLVNKYFDIKENDDIFFYRVSDMNFNTAIYFGGDNYDGFNITLTDE